MSDDYLGGYFGALMGAKPGEYGAGRRSSCRRSCGVLVPRQATFAPVTV